MNDNKTIFPSDAHPVVLFDGVCNYCNAFVQHIIQQDRKGIYRFGSLQSDAGKSILQYNGLLAAYSSSVVLVDNNKAYVNSSAVLKLYSRLPWYWKWTQLLWLVPKFIRDGIYAFIARNRYKRFGRKLQCTIPTPEQRKRFIA
jgi:predicted DCC family thiol-disulfide oxidoreductase YuxK